MNVVYYRMVNGYGYVPYTSNPSLTAGMTGQPQTAIGSGFNSLGSGQGLGMLPGPQALMPTPATNPLTTSALATNPLANGATSIMPKWMLPNFSATQIQYMFRPRMTKTKATKPVRCETCNITLNSEQQAKQHFNGKSHLKKLRQANAPTDEKKKSADDESTEKKKSDTGDGEKTDDDENEKSSSPKPCSASTDDDTSSSVSKATESVTSLSSLTVAKCATTAALPTGETETTTPESSQCTGSKNQSGKDTCAATGTDTTTNTNTDCEASTALNTSTDMDNSEPSKSGEVASLSPDHDDKEQSNSSPLQHQFTTRSTESTDSQNSIQSSVQQNNEMKIDSGATSGSREKYRRETAYSSSSDSSRHHWRGNWERSPKGNTYGGGWDKMNTRGYHSIGVNRDVDVVHSKAPSTGFFMQSMMQMHHQYQPYSAASRLADRTSLLGIDGNTQDIATPLSGLPSPCLPLSPPVTPYASQQFAPSATALMPYTPSQNFINPTTATGLLTHSLLSASTGSPAVYPTTAGALPNAHRVAMLGYSNGLTGGLYAGNAVNGLNMYYKNSLTSHPPCMAANGTRMLSNGLSAFYGNELTYGNGATVDGVCNGQQGAAEMNDVSMYYHAAKASTTSGSGGQHSIVYDNSVSIPGGSTDYATSGQSSSNDDPVSKAVMDNIMGRLSRKRKTEITCNVCDITFNSDAQATEHFRGTRHIKRAKSVERDGAQQSQAGQGHRTAIRRAAEQSAPSKGPVWQEVVGYKAGWLYCKTCDISVPTSTQLQRHVASDTHRKKQESQMENWSSNMWAPNAL